MGLQLDYHTPVVTFNRKSKITAVPSMVVREFEKHYVCLLTELITKNVFLGCPKPADAENKQFWASFV